ncbi:sulfate adenylyltransferase subunit 1 [Prolixibacter denitrificans]|uniref:sulfate adenylyltransferase n=1 Tax=Prolixibacter denitrificans TaxID=1541063 RepID=A0A2P8C7H4_9BACT|nr:GTP-binding protein [Prolixibacter denitrificans]PSK80933.1 sulfate adenylyltransferase subunit 1 [Prolixibacter denitrificans]GET22335.1 hypothetical protein JCM18694_25810 [Prolixibacter denitrificans]
MTTSAITHNSYLDMDLLRFTTAGSVDDGKSTLIGRLLYDSKSIFDDQVADLEKVSSRTGEGLNLALLTDGLRAEREQGITIDVAYRYFATPKRKFIIADTPGHLQYTRNMVTGASTADLAIILIDAKQGVVEQTRRHTFIANLLGIEHIVVCINKIDLVDYDEAVFNRIVADFDMVKKELNTDVTFIPVSALKGDNVVSRSEKLPWYKGPSLLQLLEGIQVRVPDAGELFTFPIQGRVGQNGNSRYTGRISSGVLRPGTTVRVHPSGEETTVEAIELYQEVKQEALPGESVSLQLSGVQLFNRGHLLADAEAKIRYTRHVLVDTCWFSETPLQKNHSYILAHVTGETSAVVAQVEDKIDFGNLERLKGEQTIGVNDIATLSLQLEEEIPAIAYRENRTLGSIILIDPDTHQTVAAGMIINRK